MTENYEFLEQTFKYRVERVEHVLNEKTELEAAVQAVAVVIAAVYILP